MTPITALTLALVALATPQAGNLRVIDAETREPIVGATVYGVQEAKTPVWGAFWFRTSTTTAADGWATLPLSSDEAKYSWRIVRAAGYALSGSMSIPRADREPEIVELHRTFPARIELVNYLGQPLPLVHLGLCVGCGHTPDVLNVVTDRYGRATLTGVGRHGRGIADLYPVGNGVLTDYLHIDWDAAFDGGFRAVATPGATLEGRVLDAQGAPVGGVSVSTERRHRGPWAKTDKQGRFRLYGVPAGYCPYLNLKDDAGEFIAGFGGSRIGVRRILRLPTRKSGDPRTGEPPFDTATLTLNLTLAEVQDAPLIPVEIWDPQTGWSELALVDAREPREIEVIPGIYEIEVGGKGSPYVRRHLGSFDVQARGTPLAIDHELAPIRVARLEVLGLGECEDVSLLGADGEWRKLRFDSIESETGIVEAFAVPSEPFGLLLRTTERGARYVHLTIEDLAGEPDVLRARR